MTDKNPKILQNFHSPATAYEIILTELSKSGDSKDEKIVKVFEIFDQLIPYLGVYTKIMNIVRQQMFESVFSDEFTGASSGIQRMSFYTLHKRNDNMRNEKIEDLEAKLVKNDLKLKDKENENKTLSLNINSLNNQLAEAYKKIESLNGQLGIKEQEIKSLEKTLADTEADLKAKLQFMESNIKELLEEFDQKNKLIKDLSIYKNAYDEIYNGFSSLGMEDSYQKKVVNSSRKNQISSDIINAKRLEEQILTLINISTEEYDKFVEKQNEALLEKIKEDSRASQLPKTNNLNEKMLKSPLTEYERNLMSQHLEVEKHNYKNAINDLKTEYDMIINHRYGLEEKLYLFEVDKEISDYMKRQKIKLNNNAANTGSYLLQGLEEHYEPTRKGADKDQFSVQDRIFSKWACSMQYSSNGETWFDCSQLNYCNNCGDKTLICPHKVTSHESIIEIPPNTSFLRFTRPKLQYNQFIVKRALDTYKKQVLKQTDADINQNLENGENLVLTNYSQFSPSDFNNDNIDCIKLLNEGDPALGLNSNFQRIWFDYAQRTTFKRQVIRPFSYDRTISIIKQYLAYLHNQEVHKYSSLAHEKNIVDSLYDYFQMRYELDDIKYAAIYDFFTSVNFYATRSKFIEIFCHVLIGNFDRGILNYVFYLSEVIDRIEWTETDDVKRLFTIIYPFCDDDDLDNLTLDFVSFGENKINKKLVWEYIMVLILKYKEPIIKEMEFRLSTKKSEYEGFMSEVEFCNAMEDYFFINDTKQVELMYKKSLAHSAWDGFEYVVPIQKLAHIAAYFCLIQIISELKEGVDKIIQESRTKYYENESKTGPVQDKSSQVSEWKDEFIKITDIDALSLLMR